MALYPLYGVVLDIIDIGLGLLVGISYYCTPFSPIYSKDIFSFGKALYIVLSWVHNTLCKEVPPSKRIVIYIYSSLLRHGLLYSCLFLLLLCYF